MQCVADGDAPTVGMLWQSCRLGAWHVLLLGVPAYMYALRLTSNQMPMGHSMAAPPTTPPTTASAVCGSVGLAGCACVSVFVQPMVVANGMHEHCGGRVTQLSVASTKRKQEESIAAVC